MQTIQLQISDELAAQLTPYQEQWPTLLAIGLQAWQQRTHLANGEATDERLRSVLATSGLVLPPTPVSNPDTYIRQTPVPITGKPVSEIVIEQRGER